MPTLTTVRETLSAINDWIERSDWKDTFTEFFGEFWEIFPALTDGTTLDEIADELQENDHDHLQTIVLEDFLSHEWEGDVSVFEDFFLKSGNKLDSKVEAYFRTLVGSQMSVYEAIEVVPKSHIVLKNLLSEGEPIKVPEKMASTWMPIWQKVAARILIVDGIPAMTGGIVPLNSEGWEDVQKVLNNAKKELKKEQKDADPAEIEEELRYLLPDLTASLFVLQRLDERHRDIKLANTDGDELSFVELRFPVKAPVQQVASKFKAAKEFFEGPEPRTWTYVPTGRPNGTIHAQVEMVEAELFVLVNSKQRAKEITRQLEKIFKKLVGKPTAHMPKFDEEDIVPSVTQFASPEEEAEINAQVAAIIEKHYLDTLNETVPMIGGIPRELVKTEAGKKKVVQWLKTMESMDDGAMNSAPTFDFPRLWKELGIEHLRK